MDQWYGDGTVFVLSMFYGYPGLIFILCIYCHAMRDEIKASIPLSETEPQPSESPLAQGRTYSADPQQVTVDAGPSATMDDKITSENVAVHNTTSAVDTAPKTPKELQKQRKTSLISAIVCQVLQVYLLQRMARSAAQDYMEHKQRGTIFIGFLTLGYSSAMVLKSLFTVRESWALVAEQTGNPSSMSALFVLVMIGAISLPWYNLSSASRQ